jgi:hypothetical protein
VCILFTSLAILFVVFTPTSVSALDPSNEVSCCILMRKNIELPERCEGQKLSKIRCLIMEYDFSQNDRRFIGQPPLPFYYNPRIYFSLAILISVGLVVLIFWKVTKKRRGKSS